MSNAAVELSVVFENEEYKSVFVEGEINSIKRYNEKFGMWVVLKFSLDVSSAEEDLVAILKGEYIRQQSVPSGSSVL